MGVAGEHVGRRLRLARPRLVRAIGDPLQFTILRGPWGSGKTEVVEQWLRSEFTDGIVVVKVPEARPDQDSESYWAAVAALLRPLAAEAAGLPRPDGDGAADGSAADTVRALLAGLLEHTDLVLALVLDHPDRIDARDTAGRLADWLTSFRGLRIVACVRSAGLCGPARAGGVGVREVGRSDLLFTEAEIADLCAQAGAQAPPETYAALRRELSGVPVLVRAAAPTLWRFEAGPAAAWAGVDDAVAGVLDDAIDSSASLATAPAAVLAAVTGSLTRDLLESVAGPSAPPGPGDRLCGLLMPAARGGSEDEGWRLVPAVARVVLRRVGSTADPAVTRLVSDCAEELERAGDRIGVLRCARAIGEWDRIRPALRTTLRELMVTDLELARETILAVPPEVAAADPAIAAARALFHSLDTGAADPRPATDFAAVMDFGEGRQELVDVVFGGMIQAVLLRQAGDHSGSAGLSMRLGERYAAASEAERLPLAAYMPMIRLQWGINHQLAGELARAEAELRLAHHAATVAGQDYAARYSAGLLALIAGLRGEVVVATRWLELEGGFRGESGWRADQGRASGLVARVMVALERASLADADESLAELATCGPGEKQRLLAALTRACVEHLRGNAEGALDLLRRTVRENVEQGMDSAVSRRLMAITSAQLHTALGRGNEALTALSGLGVDDPQARLGRGRVWLLAGDPQKCLSEVQTVAWDEVGSTRTTVPSLLLAAAAHLELGDPAAAARDSRRAAALAALAGSVLPLLSLPRVRRAALLDAGVVEPGLRHQWDLHADVCLYPDEVRLVWLTPREREVLRLLSEGKTQRDVAESLFISHNTVKTQVRAIYRKLDAATRDEAVRAARRLSLM